jgi:hypothetical protein
VTWVSWRLQRTETLIILGILALFTALLVPTGLEMANAYHQDGLASCLSISPSRDCAQKLSGFQQHFQTLTSVANWFTLVPGLIGVLLAAPFILDLEHGTYRLAWTQSITRGRWLLGKLALPTATAALAAGGLALLLTWWRTPDTHVSGRLQTGIYDTTGTVIIGYTLFAFALALALGAVWRRAAASLTVAFVGYFAGRIFVDYWLRDRLVPAAHATWKGDHQPESLYNAHVISLNGTINGHQIMTGGGSGFLGTHMQAQGQVQAPGISAVVFHAVYQPESHYWPLQLTETGLFLGLAAILIGVAAWWTHRRAA